MPAYGVTALPAGASFLLPLIEEVVAEAGVGEQRRRLLPAPAVVVFVLGCCLFAGDCYGEVARKLAGWLGPLAGRARWPVPGSSVLAKARRRVGVRPFELLFARLAGPLAGPSTPGACAFGRRLLLMSVDGTTLDVPYTAANVAAFGPPPRGGGRGGFPQVRLLTLIGCGTRGLAGAAFGPRVGAGSSEQALARQVAAGGCLGPGMLALGDRNFSGHPVVSAVTSTGADVLIRVKASQQLPVLEPLADGSCRSVLAGPAATRRRTHRNGARRRRGSSLPPDTAPVAGIAVRVIEAQITACPAGGPPHTSTLRLVTTLADPATAPAAQLAGLYAERWESETGYRELKCFLAGGRVLRSRDPAGIRQEIWALLCAGQLIQATRAAAARAGGGLDPDRISCTVTVRAVRRQLTTSRPARPGSRAVISEILSQLLPATRRQRSYPRQTRTSTAKRRAARAPLTGTITYKITIVAPTPAPGLPGP